MLQHPNESVRDYTRRPAAKGRAMTRRQEREIKSARLFLAFAFPAALDGFTVH